MSETINWQELTPEQRDELIHEKVMNLPIDTSECEHRYGTFEVACPECKAMWEQYEPYQPHIHAKGVPRYTQSLDAAWLVVQRFTVGIDIHAIPGSTVSCRIGGVIGEPSFGVAHHPAEAICKAALEACGVEVVP